jgi:hypothetical protein
MKDTFFKKVLVTFGFLIEGRSDDELPECLIGLFQLVRTPYFLGVELISVSFLTVLLTLFLLSFPNNFLNIFLFSATVSFF